MDSKTKTLVDLQSLEFSGNEPKNKTRQMETLRKNADHSLLAKYEIRKRQYGGRSIVPMRGNCCSGCWLQQSQQTRSRAHSQVLECDHCGRLLFDPTKRKHLKIEIV